MTPLTRNMSTIPGMQCRKEKMELAMIQLSPISCTRLLQGYLLYEVYVAHLMSIMSRNWVMKVAL